ncbi:MAG: GGDEF domain-containing protein [Gammaproteobacteria bacterium]|nr:GGDEF domain-containing protein [Gammaproteobacteria bacterium]
MVKPFLWDNHFITGLTAVDNQHKKLVEMINNFGTLIATGDSIPQASFDKLIGELDDYIRYHFQTEEQMMYEAKVDPHHITHHCNDHKQFMKDVSMMSSQQSDSIRDSAASLLEFLTHWLTYHILGTDQSLAKQISNIKHGMDATDAYLATKQFHDSATEPLLTALNGLFKQVSERNQALTELNQTLEQNVRERTKELVNANRDLEQMALTDLLTTLPNRRHAMQSLDSAWQFSTKHKSPLSLIMIDADGFKAINDTHGHDAGDEVLKALSNQLVNAFRTDDIVCRMGGDEFMVLCLNTPLDGALHIAELARKSVSEIKVSVGGDYWHGSISLGVASRTEETIQSKDLIKLADNAMYKAKRHGRNQTCSSQ